MTSFYRSKRECQVNNSKIFRDTHNTKHKTQLRSQRETSKETHYDLLKAGHEYQNYKQIIE